MRIAIASVLWLSLLGMSTIAKAQQPSQSKESSESKQIKLMTLPYTTDALEPVISKKTMELHYGKHLKGYVDQVNKLKTASPQTDITDLEELVRRSEGVLYNNAGQTLNHNLYFSQFSPTPVASSPIGNLAQLIHKQWGNFDHFKAEFEATGAKLFGSGWLWLSVTPQGELTISLHQGGDSPLRQGNTLLLGIDLWEHAYYLDYNNRRADHLKALWSIIDWSIVERRLK